jgi:hypothetical protein
MFIHFVNPHAAFACIGLDFPQAGFRSKAVLWRQLLFRIGLCSLYPCNMRIFLIFFATAKDWTRDRHLSRSADWLIEPCRCYAFQA